MADDLISKSALMKEFAEYVKPANNSVFERIPTWNDAVSLVGSQPYIDAVPVVRCKECVRRNKSADLTDTVLCTWLHNLTIPKDGFCSYGKRKEA